MILGIAIGLVVGFTIAICAIGLFGANPHAELEEERWNRSVVELENARLQAEARQRGEVS